MTHTLSSASLIIGLLVTSTSGISSLCAASTDIAQTLDTLAKQHEAVLTTINNPELRSQHPILPYLQSIEQNTTSLRSFITTTNQPAYAYCISRLAASINTIATTADQLISDLQLHYGISHPNPITHALFQSIITFAIATMLISTPQPTNEQCEQTVQVIHQSLPSCARILLDNLPLLRHEPVEQPTLKKRLITIAWYLGIIGISITATVLLYHYVIKPLLQGQQELQQTVERLQEQTKVADAELTHLKQAQKETTQQQEIRQEQYAKVQENEPKQAQLQQAANRQEISQQAQPVANDNQKQARRQLEEVIVRALEGHDRRIHALEQTQHHNQDFWQNTVKGIMQDIEDKEESSSHETMAALQGALKDFQRQPAQQQTGNYHTSANTAKNKSDNTDLELEQRLDQLHA